MRNKRIILALALALTLGQFAVFRHFWLARVGAVLIHQDRIAPADAILVLGGGRGERVLQGAELYRKKYGSVVLFTGEYEQALFMHRVHWAVQARELAAQHGVPPKDTLLIMDSKSTYDDATLSKEVCLKNGYRSLIVVSEPYHTWRSWLVFRKVYRGSGIRVMLYPVQDSWYTKDTWWQTEEGVMCTNSEYVKLVYYLLRGHIF